MRQWIEINRAPVLTLWAAVVAEHLGFYWEDALTLGRAVAGLNAYSKGKALGLFEPTPEAVKEKREQLRRKKGAFSIDLLDPQGNGHPHGGRHKGTSDRSADNPASVISNLAHAFDDMLDDARALLASA